MFCSEITICIPVFERYNYFEEIIYCVLNQTYQCRILVIDNASSHSKFYNYIKNLKNENIKYFRNVENIGMTNNWNKCIELCETEYCTILHDDDLLAPRFIEFMVNQISQNTNAIAFSCSVCIGNSLNENSYSYLDNDVPKLVDRTLLLSSNLTPFPGVVFNKNKSRELKGFKEQYYPVDDMDFWYRLTTIGKVFKYQSILAFYRLSESQNSRSVVQNAIDKSYFFRKEICIGFKELFIIQSATLKLKNFYSHSYPGVKFKLPFSILLFNINKNIMTVLSKLKKIIIKQQ